MEAAEFKPGTELTFKTVVSVHERLSKFLANNSSRHFCLDLSEVLQCDSAGLALLIEARKLCAAHNTIFEIKGLSQETRYLAEFCGIEGILLNPAAVS